MSDLLDCKTNEFDCLNSNYVYDVIIIMIIDSLFYDSERELQRMVEEGEIEDGEVPEEEGELRYTTSEPARDFKRLKLKETSGERDFSREF